MRLNLATDTGRAIEATFGLWVNDVGVGDNQGGWIAGGSLTTQYRQRDVQDLPKGVALVVANSDDITVRVRRGFNHHAPRSAHKLARLLSDFQIRPATIRLDSGRTAKGYFLEAFDDVFGRYLPPQTVTTSQPAPSKGYNEFQTVTRDANVTVSNPPKAALSNGCDVVTDLQRGNSGKEDTRQVLEVADADDIERDGIMQIDGVESGVELRAPPVAAR